MDTVRFLNLEYFFNWIYELFTEAGGGGTLQGGGGLFGGLRVFIGTMLHFVLPVLIGVLAIVYFYYLFKVLDLKRLEKNRTYERIYRTQQQYYQSSHNSRWDRVVELFSSTSPSDWRVAVIEADAMLDSLVTSLGYTGDTLGEKMKNIDRGHFPTLDAAWEAHNVRNKIAHDGIDYQLSEVEKNRVYKLYEKVFSDSGFI